VSVAVSDVCAGLLELFATVSDGRSDQGRDHPVSVVLALAAAAVVAGMGGYTAITGWVADVPADVLEGLYRWCGAARRGATVEVHDLAGRSAGAPVHRAFPTFYQAP
jgi:hypothetical protein